MLPLLIIRVVTAFVLTIVVAYVMKPAEQKREKKGAISDG